MAEARSSGRIWFATILVAGIALRLARLDLHDYWVDESISIWQASTPNVVSTLVADGAHTPLFDLILSWWEGPGAPVWRSRLLCALLAVATLVALVRLARRHFGTAAGRATALVAAFSSLLVYYGQEVRPYTLVLLFSTLLLGATLDLARRPRGWAGWASYFAWGSLLLWSHYFGLLFIGSCFLGGLASRELRSRAPTWFLVHYAIVATFLPWVPFTVIGFEKFQGIDMIGRFYSWWRDLAVPFVVFTVGKSLVPDRVVSEAALLVAGVLGGGVLGIAGMLGLRRSGEGVRPLLVLALGLPVVALVIASRLHLAQYNWSRFRYVIFSCPPLLLLYGVGLAWLLEKQRKLFAILGVGLYFGANLASLGNYFFNPQYLRAPAYREASSWLRERRLPGEPIVAAHDWAFVPLWVQMTESPGPMPFYMMGVTREPFGPSRYVTSPDDLGIKPGHTFWVVDFHEWRTRSPGYPEPRPASWSMDRYPLVERESFRGIELERRRRE